MSTLSAEIFQSQEPGSRKEPPSERWPNGRTIHQGEEWAVEAIDRGGDGAIERADFYGPNARKRAEDYAAAQYPAG